MLPLLLPFALTLSQLFCELVPTSAASSFLSPPPPSSLSVFCALSSSPEHLRPPMHLTRRHRSQHQKSL